jgi:hypothetical protein
MVEPCDRERKVRAALVVHEGMDLVDDDGARGLKRLPAPLRRQEDEQRFGGRHEDVRWPAQHVLTLARRRVAGSYGHTNGWQKDPVVGGKRRDLRQRLLQVLLDVVAQRFERRHVHDLDAVGQRSVERRPDETIQAEQERGKRLAGASRRRDEHIAPGRELRPGESLRLGYRREVAIEPLCDKRVEGYGCSSQVESAPQRTRIRTEA